jgi:hypothetical protein
MYSFEHKDTEHPMRDMRTVLEKYRDTEEGVTNEGN